MLHALRSWVRALRVGRRARYAKHGEGGLITVDVLVSNPLDPSLRVRMPFIADTGATGCTLPEEVAEKLKLKQRGEADVVLADGRVVKVKMGIAIFKLGGKELYINVLYGPGFDALLGLDVMEALRIHVDVADRSLLMPIKVFRIKHQALDLRRET